MTTASVHTPKAFDPADYEVLDYCDNRRPVCMPGFDGASMAETLATHKADVAAWEAHLASLYGADWITKIHACVHCGNTNVRWITAVRHRPTDTVVTFGADCTARLGFADRHAFKLALLKRRADATAATLRRHAAVVAFEATHPDVAAARAALDNPVHTDNAFVRDVLGKLARFGSISDRQVAALAPSLARDTARATRPVEVKVAAPVGAGIVIAGTVISVKGHDGPYGSSLKMTVKVETPAGVWLAWGTVPDSLLGGDDPLRGKAVTLVANTVAGSDPSFVFFKRPRKALVVATATAATA